MSTGFSRNYEAFASEFLENLEDIYGLIGRVNRTKAENNPSFEADT